MDAKDKSDLNADITNWDTSRLKDKSHVFNQSEENNKSDFTVNPLEGASNIQDMSNMFKPSDVSADISKWDTSNIKNRINTVNDKLSNTDKNEIKPKKP